MHSKTIKVDVTDNYKLVVISDVHAHKNHLVKLLEKLNLSDEDHLVILGDFLNRGSGSLETYEYIRELQNRPNTYIMKGNHESFMQRHLSLNDDSNAFLEFLKAQYYDTLIGELIVHAGAKINEIVSVEHMYNIIGNSGSEIQSYLKSLPILCYFDDMILVHGGYDPDLCLETEETKFLKFDYYNKVAKPNEKLTIVGHWPASELRDNVLTNIPLYNEEKKIISIDGGMGCGRPTGELNALIIEKQEGKATHNLMQFNHFEKTNIKHGHVFESEPLVYLNYGNDEFEVIESKGEFSRCKRSKCGTEFDMFTSLIDPVKNYKVNFVNNFFNLEVGEEVEVCGIYEGYALVKYGGSFGWVLGSQVAN